MNVLIDGLAVTGFAASDSGCPELVQVARISLV